MYSEFDRKHTKVILEAMFLQLHGSTPDALVAQHHKCAPIIRDFGTPEEIESLAKLESLMVAMGLVPAA